MAVSRDGKMLATIAGGSRDIRLWDSETGGELFRLQVPDTTSLFCVAFAPDGKTLAVALQDKTIVLWDLATRKPRLTLRGHTNSVASLVYFPDGMTLASGSWDGTVRLWDPVSGKELKSFGDPKYAVHQVALSADGKTLATAHYVEAGGARLWNPASGKQLRVFPGSQFGISSIAVSADGKMLATSSAQTVQLWDTASRKQLHVFEGAPKPYSCWVSFSPDAKVLAVANDGDTMRLWDTATGQLIRTIHDHSNRFYGVEFSADSKLLITGSHGAVRFWDAATGAEVRPRVGHNGQVTAVAFSPDGKFIATGGQDRTVRLWHAATSKQLAQLTGTMEEVEALVFAPDGKSLVCSSGMTARLLHHWDLKTHKERVLVSGMRRDFPRILAISPDGKTVVFGSQTTKPLLIDLATAAQRDFPGLGGTVLSAAFSPDGRLIATGGLLHGDQSLSLWNWRTGERIFRLGWGINTCSLAFRPDGKTFLAMPQYGSVYIVRTDNGATLLTLTAPTHSSCAALSPDGRLAAAAGEDSIQIWELATGKPLRTIRSGEMRIARIAFSPDGTRLVSSGYAAAPLVWSLRPEKWSGPGKLTAEELDRLWADLASADPDIGQRAVWTLAAAPDQATALVDKHVPHVAGAVTPEGLQKLIRELDDDRFKVRETALADLKKLGPSAVPALRIALTKNPSAEVERRIKSLLAVVEPMAKLVSIQVTGDDLRTVRLVQMLERAGTAKARALLEELAISGSALLSNEAQLASQRLGRQ